MNAEIARLIGDVLFQTLRIALLAAAFDLCISVGIERKTEAAAAAKAKVDAETEANAKPEAEVATV
jgi:hypothetical protein